MWVRLSTWWNTEGSITFSNKVRGSARLLQQPLMFSQYCTHFANCFWIQTCTLLNWNVVGKLKFTSAFNIKGSYCDIFTINGVNMKKWIDMSYNTVHLWPIPGLVSWGCSEQTKSQNCKEKTPAGLMRRVEHRLGTFPPQQQPALSADAALAQAPS